MRPDRGKGSRHLAESQGFEPQNLLQLPVFKTGAFNHSASFPVIHTIKTVYPDRSLSQQAHLSVHYRFNRATRRRKCVLSLATDLNRRPADYKSAALPTELARRYSGVSSKAAVIVLIIHLPLAFDINTNGPAYIRDVITQPTSLNLGK